MGSETSAHFTVTVWSLHKTKGFLVNTIWPEWNALPCFSSPLWKASLKGGLLECFHLCLRSWCCVCIWLIISHTLFPLKWCSVENWANGGSGASLAFERILSVWHYCDPFRLRLWVTSSVYGNNYIFPAESTALHCHVQEHLCTRGHNLCYDKPRKQARP